MSNQMPDNQFIIIHANKQCMECYIGNDLYKTYSVSTGKNGLGEQSGSECTPRGWHRIHSIIGLDYPANSVFVGRKWTGEYYSSEMAERFPERDWILTRILQLDGLEMGFNLGGNVDSLKRYIYIHGTPDTNQMGVIGSHGCVRMRNIDIIELALWAKVDTKVRIIA